MPADSSRLRVLKTYKLFINGAFPRSESGRVLPAVDRKGQVIANYSHASRKDLRDAVRAARKAQPGWANASAYLRGQILYRVAEMLEGRAESLVKLVNQSGKAPAAARREVEGAIDRLVYYAGWTDKFSAVFSSANPVASPHWNVTSPEATGVVGVICPDEPGLLGLVTIMSAAILSGNAVVAMVSEKTPLPALELAEIIATSDVPAGVINLLSGPREELAPVLATHKDVNVIAYAGLNADLAKTVALGTATNLKRVHAWSLSENDWFNSPGEDPYRILDTVEFKTAWHPMGH